METLHLTLGLLTYWLNLHWTLKRFYSNVTSRCWDGFTVKTIQSGPLGLQKVYSDLIKTLIGGQHICMTLWMSSVLLRHLIVESRGVVCVCKHWKGFHRGESVTKKSPFSNSLFSTKAVLWAMNNHITRTSHEHIGRHMATRRRIRPIKSDSLCPVRHTHVEKMPSFKRAWSASCVRPLLQPPLFPSTSFLVCCHVE